MVVCHMLLRRVGKDQEEITHASLYAS
jgi:hypothetical protein